MPKSKVEIRTEAKNGIATQFVGFFPEAVKINDYAYAIHVGTAEDNGNPLYVKIDISAPNWYDCKNTPAFNLQEKVALYEAELAERARKAEEKKKDK